MKFGDFTEDTETFRLMSMEYRVERDERVIAEPIVQLFARDATGSRRQIEVEGFYPYLYVSESEFESRQDEFLDSSFVRSITVREGVCSDVNVLDELVCEVSDAPRETLHGENLVKISTIEPSHVPELREYCDETWEADVFFTNRFKIDTGIKRGFTIPSGEDRVHVDDVESTEDIPDVMPRVLTIDIEVWSGGEFPDTEFAEKPITSYTMHDSYSGEYKAAILEPKSSLFASDDVGELWSESDDIEWVFPEGVDESMITVDVYDSEAEMLADGNAWIVDKNPDLLTGWNCIPSGTSIQMSDGAEKNIEDISIGDEIVGMDESNCQTKDGVVLDTHQSVKTEYTVSTQQGCISSSDEHRFLTVVDDGSLQYKKLMNISEGDFIVQPKEHNDSVYEVIPEELSDSSDTDSGSHMRQNSNRETYDNLQFVEVESIEEGDTVQMYDISTSTNSFIADGFAVHNSSRNDIGNGFDYPYWINRCENINAWSFTDLSPLNQVFTKNSGTPVVRGRVMFDMLQAYKKTQIHEKSSYSLEAIAQEELGYGKEDIESLDEGWMYEPEEFMKYNIRDVGAVVDIESCKGVLEMYDHIQHVTGTPIGECADSNIGIIDILFLRQAYVSSYALPTSVKPDRDWYIGGKVYNPIPGKHENVVYPDLASLYPYLMWSLNVSPETMYESMSEVEDDGLTEDDVYRAFIDTRDDDVKRHTSPEESDIYYAKPEVKEGFVRSVIDDLVSMKYEYKKDEYSDEKYSAVKRIVNSCFTPDTEVLTPNGIQCIKDIECGDIVYSWNKETGEMEEKRVTETIEKPDYTGEIIHIQNENIDLKVTPDHRMLVQRSRYSDNWETVDAGDLNEYTHYETPNRWTYDHANGIDKIDITRFIDTDSFIVRENSITGGNRHTSFDRFVDANAFIELLGWYITEGSYYISDMNEARGDKVAIAQNKNVNNSSYDRIVDTIKSLNAHASKSETSVELCGSVYSRVFTDIAGSGSKNKRIPEFIFEECSREQKELLFDVLMLGDGDSCNNRYTTKSTELRDDVIQLLWELGYKPTYTYDDGGENNSGVWRIRYTCDDSGKQSKQSFRMNRDASTELAENGVYCIQVEDNHTLVAGRNGKFTNIWNCYGVFGDSHSFGTGFRLYDWRLAETVTLAGQNVLDFTSNSFIRYLHNHGYEDAKRIGGDTDSVQTKIPSLDVEPDEIQEDYESMQSGNEPEIPFFKAASYVDERYDEYMEQKFWIRDSSMHKMEVEIESYADSLFFLQDMDVQSQEKGVKKRYAQLTTWDEGEVIEEPTPDIKGFESIRSDSAIITEQVQRRVFDIILSEDNPKESVTEYLSEKWDMAKHGEIDDSMIGIPSKINKSLESYGGPDKNGNYSTPQPHIRGARYANTHVSDVNISSGDKPLFFYVRRVGYPYPDVFVYDEDWDRSDARNLTSDTVKELGSDMDAISVNDVRNLPDEIKIDYEEMAVKTIRDPLEDIVKTMGWTFKDVSTSTSQTGMAYFM